MTAPSVRDAVFTPGGGLVVLERDQIAWRNAATGALESAEPLGTSEPSSVANTGDWLLLTGTFHDGATFPSVSIDYDGPAPLRYLWRLPNEGADSIEILGCEGSLGAASGRGALYVMGETRAGVLLAPQALLESDAGFIARLE